MKSYIIIPIPKHKVQPSRIASLFGGLLRRVLPEANPDFHHQIERVTAFHVELDADGSPERELGVDASGQTVFIAPWRENLGVILDSYSEPFDASKHQQIPAEQFEQEWKSYESQPVA